MRRQVYATQPYTDDTEGENNSATHAHDESKSRQLTKEQLLAQRQRVIFAHVIDNPGLQPWEIAQELQIRQKEVEGHLHVLSTTGELQKEKKVITDENRSEVRYYPIPEETDIFRRYGIEDTVPPTHQQIYPILEAEE